MKIEDVLKKHRDTLLSIYEENDGEEACLSIETEYSEVYDVIYIGDHFEVVLPNLTSIPVTDFEDIYGKILFVIGMGQFIRATR